MNKSLTLFLAWFAFLLFCVYQGVYALADGPLDPYPEYSDGWHFFPAADS